jgi:hypothetical protein
MSSLMQLRSIHLYEASAAAAAAGQTVLLSQLLKAACGITL